jgi:outer membrane protein OmpA-like peptidoglycan-associated protein
MNTTPVEAGMTYDLNADAPGYLPGSASKLIEMNEKKPVQRVVIELQPMVLQVLVINSVTKAPIPGVFISCTSPCNNVPKNNLTNESGKINYSIKDKCTYTILASAKSYLPKPATQITTTLKDTTFVVIELVQITEKAITLNNIYYDFDKWNIRPEAEVDLNMLLTFMKDNPDAIVELSSHTDARGDDKYNQVLSQKRAQSAVDWLVARGISISKIKPVGYGEKQPVNQCVNNVKCTEEEHQRNRRTEFKVLNAGEIINSKMKEEIKVDPCKNCLF